MERQESTGKTKRIQTERRLMHEEKVGRVPIENMVFKDLPPPFISVVGPPQSGKSTLVKSIVKYLTHQQMDGIKGPVTLSSPKTRRMTLFEARADVHQFVDVSKVSDLVVFTINGETGLEMETFEFLSLLMSHGLSKVLCVVTHTDRKRGAKYLKSLKKRIWAEICPGIKFFYVGRIDRGVYVDGDMSRMCRVLGVMKYRPIEWKCTHPHIVVDKMDKGFVYGYVRGGGIRKDTHVHIPGFGDSRVVSVGEMEDPVPPRGEARLSPRSKIVYSPMVDVPKEEAPQKEVRMEESSGNIRLFRKSREEMKEVSKSTEDSEMEEEVVDGEECSSGTEESSLSFSELKDATGSRFQKTAMSEEELVEKFNRKYVSKDRHDENFLFREKRKLEELGEKSLECGVSGMIMPGQYVRVELEEKLPPSVDFRDIIVLGAVLVSEGGMEVIQGKIKRHKWSGRILKSGEPVIFSVGWRRFQSIPVFSMKDASRNRAIKYTPNSMHCNVTLYGPVVPAGTGFSVYTEKGGFRVLGFGSITDVSGDSRLVKKLKLVGYPKEILQNTVFVRDMFTSDLEVTKFQGASLKSVSGLRGQIKGPRGKCGEYRATFEGKMLMSDIITLRCFVPVDVSRVSVPVNNLVGEWKGLRRLYEIRRELGIEQEHRESSSSEESEYVPSETIYDLPYEIESRLPLDKRRISVVSTRIELPVAPDAREGQEWVRRMMEQRRKKDEEDGERRKMQARREDADRRKIEKIREEKIRKTIQENHRERQKKFRKR